MVLDRERLLDLIDQVRAAVPAEIADARAVLQERQRVMKEAEEEGRLLVAQAKREAEAQLSGHELVRHAQRRATEIMTQVTTEAKTVAEDARNEAAAIRGSATSQAVEQAIEADRYSLDVLRRLEEQLAALLSSIRAGIEQLDKKLEREQGQWEVESRNARTRDQGRDTDVSG